MSKQSAAKEYQGYTERVIPMVCGNCAHYQSKVTEIDGPYDKIYSHERSGAGLVGLLS